MNIPPSLLCNILYYSLYNLPDEIVRGLDTDSLVTDAVEGFEPVNDSLVYNFIVFLYLRKHYLDVLHECSCNE